MSPHFSIPRLRPGRTAPLLVLIALVLSVPEVSRAGAWAEEDKGLYLKLSGAYGVANWQFKDDGERFRLLSPNERGRFESRALRFYGAFGIAPDLTFVASTSFVSARVESDFVTITTTGLSDVSFGLKYQFLDEPFVGSVRGRIYTPTGYTPDPRGLKTPPLGLGVPMYQVDAMAGKSFHPIPLYASASFGIRFRGSRTTSSGTRLDYPPELPYSLEVGVDATDWLLVRGMLRGLQGLGDPSALSIFTLTPRTQSYVKVGPGVIVTIWDDIQVALDYRYTVAGVNALQSHEFSLGVAVDTVF